jgi:uncharacterized protein YihD (DUF1040 family)
MREPERIDRIIDLLRETWHLESGFRLTQLIMVVSDKAQDAGALWHVEDATMEEKLRSYLGGLKRRTASN